jgi:ketosteroid isomerase-like protein
MVVIPSFPMKRVLLSISALIILAGCSHTPAPAVASRETDIKSLRAAQEAAIEAFASKDADRMVSAYSADASLMFPNSPILQGEDLRTAIKALAADPNFSIQFSTDKAEVAKSGEVGYTRGTYTMTMSDPNTRKPFREKGKYVTIYARQADGSWKMIEDISNADAPAIPVALAK